MIKYILIGNLRSINNVIEYDMGMHRNDRTICKIESVFDLEKVRGSDLKGVQYKCVGNYREIPSYNLQQIFDVLEWRNVTRDPNY